VNTGRRHARAADHLPVPPRATLAASGREDRVAADHDGPMPAPRTRTDGVDTPREVSESENTLDFEAAIWFG
jgi:hypothetical protein